jgi:hypothetical protein
MDGDWKSEGVVPSLTCRVIQAFGGPKSLQWGGMIQGVIRLQVILIQYKKWYNGYGLKHCYTHESHVPKLSRNKCSNCHPMNMLIGAMFHIYISYMIYYIITKVHGARFNIPYVNICERGAQLRVTI